jgi:DNA modification methylase
MAEKRTDAELDEGQPEVAAVALPEQKQFFKIPARFGHVPVAEQPLGYDPERRFEQHYPRIELPFQLVDTVETAAKRRYTKDELFPNGLNRLFFGDCLHVMRMLPSECIDLIYIDPPFFSGRNYNIIFGDRNEVRSFTDIWEGGMPGYLIWLNTRLYEMKRLLKPTGSLFVHLDWHASHYVKCELDRLFGYDHFRNELVWNYRKFGRAGSYFPRSHDAILFYSRTDENTFYPLFVPPSESTLKRWGTKKRGGKDPYNRYATEEESPGAVMPDHWDINLIIGANPERIGYPTQKPLDLMQRIIEATTRPGDTVADFFCGGGSLVAAAAGARAVQNAAGDLVIEAHPDEARRWIGCDISRVAVALTADRVARILAPNLKEMKKARKVKKGAGLFTEIVHDATLTSVEDAKKKVVEASPLTMTGYSVEHWGIYEINRLTKLPEEAFRMFVLQCYGARKWTGSDPNIHGSKQSELLWIGGPKETDIITATNVRDFAHAVIKTKKPEERRAVMIAWGIDPRAKEYADQLMMIGEQRPIQFIRLLLWPLPGEELKTHVTRRHPKYKEFFAFILPPDVPRVGITRLGPRKYKLDVSEARSMNPGGKIVNVQWDFDFRDGIFSASQGYQLCRTEKKGKGEHGFEGLLVVEYEFEDVEPGTEVAIACRVQDDLGGEGTKVMKVKVE